MGVVAVFYRALGGHAFPTRKSTAVNERRRRVFGTTLSRRVDGGVFSIFFGGCFQFLGPLRKLPCNFLLPTQKKASRNHESSSYPPHLHCNSPLLAFILHLSSACSDLLASAPLYIKLAPASPSFHERRWGRKWFSNPPGGSPTRTSG